MKRRAPTREITRGKKIPAANGARPDPGMPPLQQSTSPEIPLPDSARKRLKIEGSSGRSSRSTRSPSACSGPSASSEVVYGSPVMGLAVGRFRDRRKTRPTAILTTIDVSSNAASLSCSSKLLKPAFATVRWMGSSEEEEHAKEDKENDASFEVFKFSLPEEGSIDRVFSERPSAGGENPGRSLRKGGDKVFHSSKKIDLQDECSRDLFAKKKRSLEPP